MPGDRRIHFRTFLDVAAAGYVLVLTVLLVMPSPLWLFGAAGVDFEETVDRSVSDLFQHALAYFLLTTLSYSAMESRLRRAHIIVAASCLAHAVGSEFLQYYIPNRTCDGRDMAANAVGVLTAVGSILLTTRIMAAFGNIDPGRTIRVSSER